MRLYVFLPLALCAIAARAATIPDIVVPPSEKKIDDIKDKIPDNESSEQELIDQANTINDVDNNLRVKPVDIPVKVIVENVEPAVKTPNEKNESDDIVRPPVDLKNPGPPQRQEHETQNPEFYAAEQKIVETYKQNMNDAQVMLRQGFQGISESVQNMLQHNEQVKSIQQGIQALRERFSDQINKLNSTIQNYINTESSNTLEQQTKANIQRVESGLSALKNDFTIGVKALTDGVELVATLRDETDKPVENKPSTGTPAQPEQPAQQGAGAWLLSYINRWQQQMQENFNNLSQTLTNYVNQSGQSSQPSSGAAVPSGAQSDTQAPAQPAQPSNQWFPNFPNPLQFFNLTQVQNQVTQQGSAQQPGPIMQFINGLGNPFQGFLSGNRPTETQPSQPVKPAEPAKPVESASSEQKPSEPEKKPEADKPVEPVAQASQPPAGPIRQILQNNPISQGIAGAVQRLQNINNPEKPREPAKEKAIEDPAIPEDQPKGHPPAVGDNNNSSDGVNVVKEAPVKEVQKEVVPEEPVKEEKLAENQTQEVDNKTE